MFNQYVSTSRPRDKGDVYIDYIKRYIHNIDQSNLELEQKKQELTIQKVVADYLKVFHAIYQFPLLLSVYKGLKYVIHVTTRTSEIYRLCNIAFVNEKEITVSKEILYRIGKRYPLHIYNVTYKNYFTSADRSIFYSSQLREEKYQLEQPGCPVQEVVTSVALKKEFSKESLATQVLATSLNRIYDTNQVLYSIEQQVKTKYDSNNSEHEQQLMDLWNRMKPDTPLETRISKQWVDIGFQGSDPATDFRGMGMQGLLDLLYFVKRYPTYAQSVLQHASHPTNWYPYAIVGINITKFCYQTLESRKLQMFLFQYGANVDMFQEFYCYLFNRFNQFWITHEPSLSVMDFESKFIEFKQQVEKDLLLETIILLK
ncbi:hypothetical protein HPULCUR_000156 [Helicostylum pulchrum]|uniref:ELMO domain-containing protein n=1 Tax=Helicostylum pulchrum TaxID=562976 RepID=A0ABP9XJ58_9FUNG